MPDNPRGWLVAVASRRMTDRIRSDSARRRREDADAALAPAGGTGRAVAPAVDADADDLPARHDDTLTLLLLCCHPALSPASQLALTLRAVGGLTTAQVAAAFLVPEATMAQRISRAKQTIRAAGSSFPLPAAGAEREQRLRIVLHVLYLMFNEGHTATSGADLVRAELTGEAIRLARAVHRLLPDDGEVAGLLSLMLLTAARRPARSRPDGTLVPLADQDRGQWDRDAIAEGVALVTAALLTCEGCSHVPQPWRSGGRGPLLVPRGDHAPGPSRESRPAAALDRPSGGARPGSCAGGRRSRGDRGRSSVPEAIGVGGRPL